MQTHSFLNNCRGWGLLFLLLFLCVIPAAQAQHLDSWTPVKVEVPAQGGRFTVTLQITQQPPGFTLQVLSIDGAPFTPDVKSYEVSGNQITITIGKNLLGQMLSNGIGIRTNAGVASVMIDQPATGEAVGGIIFCLDPALEPWGYGTEEIVSPGNPVMLDEVFPTAMEPVRRYFWQVRDAGYLGWSLIPGATDRSLTYDSFTSDVYFRRGAELTDGRVVYSNEVYCRAPVASDLEARKNIVLLSPEVDYNGYVKIASEKKIGQRINATYRWEYRHGEDEAWKVAAGQVTENVEWFMLTKNTYFRRLIIFEGTTFSSNVVYARIRLADGGKIAASSAATEAGGRVIIRSEKEPSLSNFRYGWEQCRAGSEKWTAIAGAQEKDYETEALTRDYAYRRKAMTASDTFYSNEVSVEIRPGNYIETRTYLSATPVAGEGVYVRDITYLDGYGREVQKIEVNASPSGNADIVMPLRYGRFGRREWQYLPYARTGNNGAYHADAFSSSNWSAYGNADQGYAFTRTDYDDSPLDRVVRQTGPGAAWHTAGKGVSTSYTTNAANQVVLWRVDENGNLLSGGYYAAHTLPCVRVTDEDGRVRETFTDVYDGKERTLLSAEVCGEERYETYYVYNDYGNLSYVLSPEASSRLRASGVSEEVIKRYAYRYRYDRWGRQIEKRLPGCEAEYFVYDRKDRLVLSQDGNQRTSNTWSYSLYDPKNRVIETGEIGLGSKSHAQLQEEAGSSGNYIPSGTRTALQYSLYDSYAPTSLFVPHAFVSSAGYALSYHPLVAGLLTATKTRILDTDAWQTTTLYYDDRGRVIQTVSDNRLGGVSRSDMKYDFVDRLMEQRESHGKSSGQADVLESVNSYDNRGRLLSESIRLNGGTAATVTYEYDALGRLTGCKYGNLSETLSYNIRGWLTGKTSSPFRMSLRYESPQGGSTACYNGQISEWEWQQGTDAALMYGFTYDGPGRFIGAVEKQKSGDTWPLLSGHYTEQGLSYDRNGNLLSLQRTAGGAMVDHLAYSYTGNQLTAVTESVRTSPMNDIYAPGSAAAGSYGYDANGNLINDSRRALNFGYNVLNLLSEVRSGGTLKASYTWLADGTKLGVRDGSGANGFEYVGSLIYRKSGSGFELSEVLFGDGVIRLNDNGTQEVNYFLRDHLGSVRVIADAGGSVKERNDYYPFGARHVRSDYAQSTNRWKYNGKEEQRTGNLEYLDYGARMYDPGLGRWMTVDPMAENYLSYSPYHFSGNNPLVYVDSDGRMMDWYSNASGSAILWRDSKEKELEIEGETYYNIGSSISFNIGGLFLNYYQNILVSTSTKEVDVMTSLLNNPRLLSKLLNVNSPLSEANQLELLINSIHKGQQDFLNHPVTQATINTLAFVATGGVEGAMALGSMGKSLIGNIKIPVYRVYGGASSMYGKSYSLFNPKYIPNYRNFAGLPRMNSGQYLLKGNISVKDIKIGRWFASPLEGTTGGLPIELYQRYDQLINPVNVIINKPF